MLTPSNSATISFPDCPDVHFDVRQYSVQERLSELFAVTLVARAHDPSVDFERLIGKPATFEVGYGGGRRKYTGICVLVHQSSVLELREGQASTYRIFIVPKLYLAGESRDYEVFQVMSEIDIARKLLDERGVQCKTTVDKSRHPKRKYRVQYGESDFDFMSRMLEESGVSYYFETAQPPESPTGQMVLTDAPESAERRGPIPWVAEPDHVHGREFATAVDLGRRFRPGKVVLGDFDHRRPTFPLREGAESGLDEERRVERFAYSPGEFLFEASGGGDTPIADDRGAFRPSGARGKAMAERRLGAMRADTWTVTFTTNALDLRPGTVTSISGHPHAALGSMGLLVVDTVLSGDAVTGAILQCSAVSAEVPYSPVRKTSKPLANGLESAMVVGPAGEEIHTDEFGRVRVQFHWDRGGKKDEKSSCWVHVSQPWAGTGFGGSCIPRVGQEVLVAFFGGDPDRPVVVGRLYNGLSATPWKLPQAATQSGFRTQSTGGNGGHNEFMLEDKQGQELVRIRAQKDLVKKVVANELEHTGSCRTIDVAQVLTVEATEINLSAKRIRINGAELTDVKGGVIKLNCD